MYPRYIDIARKTVPIVMVVFGAGTVIFANLREEFLAGVFGLGVCACFVVALGLFAEHLIRAWFFRPGRSLPWYQFTLGGMFGFTTAVAVICAIFKIIGWAALGLLIGAMVLTACAVEAIQRSGDKNDRS